MTTARAIPARFDDSASGWERALYAFLAEKERRSGSKRTVQSYSRMLQDFFGRLGKPPDQVTSQDVFAYAHGVGLCRARRDFLQTLARAKMPVSESRRPLSRPRHTNADARFHPVCIRTPRGSRLCVSQAWVHRG